MIKKILDPYKVFISILIAAAFWLAPIGAGVEQIPVAGQIEPLQEFSDIPKLVLAIVPEVSADCAAKCKEPVCLKWVPIGGSCQPTNPWDIGCCTKYGTVCNEELPGCGPVDPPPPSYLPPTVSASLTCTTWGNSGWCINNGAIAITAADPQNFAVTVSGNITVNGASTPFSCANPCNLSMPSGSGTVTYTATAATSGLSSAAGNTAFKFDPGDPAITSNTSGAQSGSWHTAAGATVTVLSSDSISGLQSVSITRNGAAVTSPFSLADGSHNITAIATDVAGNQYTSSFTVKVDSVKPVISFNTTGLLNGAWYRSATVAVSATDATSGVQTLLITDNGFAKASPIALFDGTHTIFATATDNAGNVQAAPYNIKVDGTPPSIVPAVIGTAGDADWWVSAVSVDASFSDATSGLVSQSFSQDGGTTWTRFPYSILADGIHQIGFRSEDKAGNVTEIMETVKIDKSAPTLSVSNTGTLGENGWYVSTVQVNATASDATSGIFALKVNVDGVWDTYASPVILGNGVHTMRFQALDNAGNTTTTATQTIRVDTNAPSIIPIVSGTNGSNGWYISNAQVSASAADTDSGLDTLMVAVDGNARQAYASSITLSEGLHSVQFQGTDIAGNTFTTNIPVKVDTTAPQVVREVVGTKGENGWYVSDVTIEATASDATSGSASLMINLDGTWKTYASPIVLGNGLHTVQFQALDNAGNVTTTKSQIIGVDKISPIISMNTAGTSGSNGWYTSITQVSASMTEAGSGPASLKVSVDGSAWQAYAVPIVLSDGLHSLQFQGTDIAGNTSLANIVVKVDTTFPQVNNEVTGTAGSNGWYLSDVTIKATASDATSGKALLMANLDGTWIPYTNPFVLSDGLHTIQLRAFDNAGNVTTTTPQIFQVDTTGPAISPTVSGASGSNGWYTSNVEVNASTTDTMSGPGVMKASVDGGAWKNYSAPITLSDGLHIIQFQAADIAGNSTTTNTTLKVDTTAPQMLGNLTGTAGDDSWYTSDVTAQAANTDATSGIASEKHRLDGGAWQTGRSIPVSEDGLHTLDFLAIDNAGNQKTISQSFKIDQTPPQITLTPIGDSGSNGWYVSNVSLEMLSNDTTSGVSSAEYDLDETGWKPLLNSITLTDGRRGILARSRDKAGNSTTASILIKVDTVPPAQALVLDGVPGSNDWYISDVLVDVSALDATSGNVITTITDNGRDASFDPITLTEGIHTLHYMAVDEAGNSVSASDVVSVDTTIPTNTLSSPFPNSVAIDTVQVGGQSADLTSGLSINQISFDNLNWLSLPNAIPDWYYDWETADLPNGSLSIFARSIDQAGNTGIPTQVNVVLDNHPPFLELSSSWNIWESGTLSVEPNVTPLESVRIVIKDPFMRYPNEVFFDDLPAPKQITWDRIFGSITAPPGSYPVEVEACDIYGVCSIAIGMIIIPEGIPTPIPQPFVFPPVITKPPVIAPTQVVTPTQLPQAVLIPPQLEPVVVPPLQPVWPATLLIMLLFMFAILLLLDPRPTALWSLAKTIQGVINHDR